MTCDRCGLPLEPDEAHWDHEAGCRRAHLGHNARCVCDLQVHSACCRSCVPMLAHKNGRAS